MSEEVNYVKLALKYRPKTLDEVFGQDSAVLQFKGMFKNKRLTNTLLFAGASGCGKTTLGRLVHRYINCTDFNYDTVTPCGECFACKSEYSSDYIEVDGATNRGIESIRDLQQIATLSPQGKYRTILIDECHALTPQSFQALLKLLEEPPAETIIILCTTDPEKLPETITGGRCRRFDIVPVKDEDCVALLSYIVMQEGMDESVYCEDLFKDIAAFAKGSLRNAVTALESVRDYIDGKGTITDIKSILTEINDIVLRAPEWQIALHYLLSIYRGKYTGALRVVESITSYESFIKILMEYHTQTIYWLMSDKLKNMYTYKWYYEELEKAKIPNDIDFATKAAKTMETLVNTASDIKSYLVDAKYLMIAMTVTFSTMYGTNKGE